MTEQEIKLLIEEVVDKKIPVGTIICYTSSSCPDGYLPCDGRELIQSQYPELYKVIGNAFGGSPKTFCLPDLQGRFIRGWDEEGDTDPEREFGSVQEDAFQGHIHDFHINGELSSSGEHKHRIDSYGDEIAYGTNTFGDNKHAIIGHVTDCDDDSYDYGKRRTGTSGQHTHLLPKFEVGEVKSSTFRFVKIDTETRPKNIALLYCIKVK